MRTTAIPGALLFIGLTLAPLAAQAQSWSDMPGQRSGNRPPVDSRGCALSRSCPAGASIDILPFVTARKNVGTLLLRGVPEHAEVYIDRAYAGHARDFDGTSSRATLTTGVHRVDVRAEGYTDMSFETRIAASRATVHHVPLQPAAK